CRMFRGASVASTRRRSLTVSPAAKEAREMSTQKITERAMGIGSPSIKSTFGKPLIVLARVHVVHIVHAVHIVHEVQWRKLVVVEFERNWPSNLVWHRHSCLCFAYLVKEKGTGKSACATQFF